MSSDKFVTLIDEFPEETAAVRRLIEVVEKALATPGRKEFSPTRMYDLVQPSNFRVLIRLLASASHIGLVRKAVRVYSPSGLGSIEDFDSVVDVPSEIYDTRTGYMVEVTREHLELIYSIERR